MSEMWDDSEKSATTNLVERLVEEPGPPEDPLHVLDEVLPVGGVAVTELHRVGQGPLFARFSEFGVLHQKIMVIGMI